MAEQDGPPGSEAGSLREHPVREVSLDGGKAVVRLAGELDLYNAGVVRDALLAATDSKPERIVVDLGEVVFMDSTALGVLIEARAKLANRGALVLADAGLETRRALEISGLDRHLGIYANVEEALAAEI